MYTQLIGCFIMGYTVTFKKIYFDQTSSRLTKSIYLAITSGLCGSITSFSSWQIQCNKNFFLQWDLTWGNYLGSHNGGRLFEWLVCMWAGVALPISALHFGYYCGKYYLNQTSELSPSSTPTSPSNKSQLTEIKNNIPENKLHEDIHQHNSDANQSKETNMNHITEKEINHNENNFNLNISYYEGATFMLFLITMILIIVLPVAVYPDWIHFTYSSGL